MFKYDKKLPYPINIKRKDIKLAKYIITQYGGYAGELGAALRYFSQKFTMPTDEGRALLNDIATEEIGHAEMICVIVHQLLAGASKEELEKAGLTGQYVEHGLGIYPVDVNGIPFDAKTFASTGDAVVDLAEDMAAEQKALATYYQLINLTDDPDIKEVLSFLGQREITHYQRFGEALMEVYDFTESKKIF